MTRVQPKFLSLSLFVLLLPGAAGAATSKAPETLGRDERGVPTFVRGELGTLPRGIAADLGAAGFLRSFALEHLGAAGSESFAPFRVKSDELGQVHVRAQQMLHGMPVVGAELVLHADAASGRVLVVNGRFAKDDGVPAKAEVDATRAFDLALIDAEIVAGHLLETPRLGYVVDPESGAPRLAWSALVASEGENGPELDRVFADALVGGLVTRHPQHMPVLNRQTFTAGGGTNLPGTLLISEGGSSTDTVAQTAHTNAGITYNYFNTRHGRDSLDGNGMTLTSTVHYGSSYNNAFWSNDRQQMVYGDGDGTTFSPLGGALDVVAHELTHGLTSFESGLVYERESGAINEALSDVFGAATEAFANGVSTNTWRLGEAVYTPGTANDALRYMWSPTADGYSKDYYPERLYPGSCSPNSGNDYCGVHGNSGIANLAFYLVSQGGWHPRSMTPRYVDAIGINAAERIYFRAATLYLGSTSNYNDLRNALVQSAVDLFGAGSVQARRVSQSYCTVGIGNVDCLTELSGSGTTFGGKRIASLNWRYSDGASVDVFKDGVKVMTTPNDGGQTHMYNYLNTPSTANYWVCHAGSTSYYDSSTCSNVFTVDFGSGGGGF